jgi:hypothetical protein
MRTAMMMMMVHPSGAVLVVLQRQVQVTREQQGRLDQANSSGNNKADWL